MPCIRVTPEMSQPETSSLKVEASQNIPFQNIPFQLTLPGDLILLDSPWLCGIFRFHAYADAPGAFKRAAAGGKVSGKERIRRAGTRRTFQDAEEVLREIQDVAFRLQGTPSRSARVPAGTRQAH